MPSLLQNFSVLAGIVTVAQAAFGPYFSTGATSSGVYIKQATATLVLPDAPTNNQGDLSLWVGMGTSDGDLIQSIADCYVCHSLFFRDQRMSMYNIDLVMQFMKFSSRGH